jgi:hypothetical protein
MDGSAGGSSPGDNGRLPAPGLPTGGARRGACEAQEAFALPCGFPGQKGA